MTEMIIIPTLEEMDPREAFEWEAWKMFVTNCRRRQDPEFDFEKLTKEAQAREYCLFKETYEKVYSIEE